MAKIKVKIRILTKEKEINILTSTTAVNVIINITNNSINSNSLAFGSLVSIHHHRQYQSSAIICY
eukprot:scaffold15063_cov143-Skeletonema_marinoi.AAC.3